MAEIKIEQKKQIWPWLLVGLIIVAVIIYFMMNRDSENVSETEVVTEEDYNAGTNDTNLLSIKENNSTVAAFVGFVENDTNRVSLDQSYINEAFIKLTAATSAMAEEIDYNIQSDLEKVNESTVLIENENFDSSSSKNIRNAADNSATALQNMQQAKYPWLAEEVEELKSASAEISAETKTLEQEDAVKNYFVKAADLLQKMN
jgi:hypothetical protein